MTPVQRSPSLYETPAFQAAAGPALRPGGLELTRRAMSFCGLPAGSRVADIGCGTGATVHYLRRHFPLKAVGLDRSAAMLDRARQQVPGLPMARAEAAGLPFGDGCLSAVLCECVLSLVEDLDAAWREIRRVLSPGGLLVLADLYARAPRQGAGPAPLAGAGCLAGARPRDDLVERMHRFGFTLLVWEDHSEDLKRLAARLVFAGGSLRELRGAAEPHACKTAVPREVHAARPGYFLAVARKESSLP